MKIYQPVLLSTCLFFSNVVTAASLGEIELMSSFNEPFKARVPIYFHGDSMADINQVKLAEPYAYHSMGLDYQPGIESISASLFTDKAEKHYVWLESSQNINQLYLDVVIDLSTEDAKLSRTYTVLMNLDTFDNKRFLKAKASPVQKKQSSTSAKLEPKNSHSMESTLGHDSHDMKGSSETSHSMESNLGHDSHDMKGSSEASHSMESNLGHDSHDMKGSSESSHSMESTLGHDSHDMKGSSESSHSMESTLGHDSHDMKGSSESSHSMESTHGHDSHDMKGSSESSHSMESTHGHDSQDMKGSSESSHNMELTVAD